MRVDDALDDVEAQAHAAMTTPGPRGDLLHRLEDVANSVGWDHASAVVHRERDGRLFAAQLDPHSRVGRAVVNGVGEESSQDLGDAVRI